MMSSSYFRRIPATVRGGMRICSLSVFPWFRLFCDIFWRDNAVEGRESVRNGVIICQNSVKSPVFCICNSVVFSEMKNKWKINEKSWKNSWRERKKSYLCTRKTTGTTVNEEMEVVWRSSLNEWSKQSLKGKEVHKKRTLSILADRSGRDRIILYKNIKFTMKSLILAQDER